MTRFAKLLVSFTLVLCSCFLIGYGVASGFSNYTAKINTTTDTNQSNIHDSIIYELNTPTTNYSNNNFYNYTDNNSTISNNNINNNSSSNNTNCYLYNLVDSSSNYYVDSPEFKNFNLEYNIKVKKSEKVDLDINIKSQIEKTQSGLPNVSAKLNCKVITKYTSTNVNVEVYIKQNICYVNVLGSKYSFNLNKTVTKVSELVSYVLEYVKDFDLVKELSNAINAIKTNENYLTFKENLYNNTKSFIIKVPSTINNKIINETIITLKDNKFSTLNYTNILSTNINIQLNMTLNSSQISFPNLNGYINIF